VNGEILEFTDEEVVIENILDVIQDQFSCAENAPISNCSITDDLGDFGFTDLSLQIIRGEVQIPDDIDEATTTLLEAIEELGEEYMDNQVDTSMSTARILYVSRLKYLLESLCKSNANGHQTTAPTIINS
jgi:hypothetical protein